MLRNKGHSLTAWVVIFSVIIAVVLLMRVPVKNALQAKVVGVTDYLLWKKYGQDTQQHKGDDTSFSKAKVKQSLDLRQGEREGRVGSTTSSVTDEDTASSGVEEGSQAVLKAVDLNEVMP